MKQSITKFLALMAIGSACLSAYADAGLTITEASYSAPGDIYAGEDNRVTGHTLSVTLENTGDVALAPGDEGYTLTLYQTSGPTDLQVFPIGEALAPGGTLQLELPCD